VVPDKTVSREHARIVRMGEGYGIEDLGSVNGTFVNGQRVQGRLRLADQDRIQLYDVGLRFHEGPVDPRRAELSADSTEVGGPPPFPNEPSDAVLLSIDAGASGGEGGETGGAGAEARLEAVLEIVRNLGSSLAVEEMLERVLDSLFVLFGQAARGHVLLSTGPGGDLVPRGMKDSREPGGTGGQTTLRPINRQLAVHVMAERRGVLISQAIEDAPRKAGYSTFDDRQRSVICAPLMGPSADPAGVIHLESDDPDRQFRREDLDILMSVATVAGRAVELGRAHEAQVRLERRTRELAGARDVQLHLLPQERPQVAGYRFADYYAPAEEVGGDFYTYVPLADGRLAIVVGDVAGKGLPAALMMAQLSSEVRYRLAAAIDLAAALAGLNDYLAGMNDRFVTMVMAVLDPKRHTLTVINAGHMPPLRRPQGGPPAVELAGEQGSPPLGIDRRSVFPPEVFSLAPGDLVVLYTDGVSEARNPAGEPFGMGRVRERVGEGPADAPGATVALWSSVEEFSAGRPPADDVCIVALAREGG
jgi:serine phosphatase RsbU (regulator of sigma subunit)